MILWRSRRKLLNFLFSLFKDLPFLPPSFHLPHNKRKKKAKKKTKKQQIQFDVTKKKCYFEQTVAKLKKKVSLWIRSLKYLQNFLQNATSDDVSVVSLTTKFNERTLLHHIEPILQQQLPLNEISTRVTKRYSSFVTFNI